MNLMVSVLISRKEYMRIAKENYKPNGDKKKEVSPMSTPGVDTERSFTGHRGLLALTAPAPYMWRRL